MAYQPFTITVTLDVEPMSVGGEIATAFQDAYKDQGPTETGQRYIERKCEEYILSVFSATTSDAAGLDVAKTMRQDINDAASIKQPEATPAIADISQS